MVHAGHVAANESDDLFGLLFVRCLAQRRDLRFSLGAGTARTASHGLGHEFAVQVHARVLPGHEMRASLRGIVACGQRLSECDAAAVIDGEDLGKHLVDAIDQLRRGAEVSLELHGFESQRKFARNFKADLFHARKKFCIGIAEKVDGLHGVADDEAGAAFALGPGCDKVREQLMLAAAGVLKFVDEQVANAVGRRAQHQWGTRLRF